MRSALPLALALLVLPRCSSTDSDARAPEDAISCVGLAPITDCVNSCWSDALLQKPMVCAGGAWVCPQGFYEERECAGGKACGYMPAGCCDACDHVVELTCGSMSAPSCRMGLHMCAAGQPVDAGCEVDGGGDAATRDAGPDTAGRDSSLDGD